jgi:hypothetical protein
MQPHVAGFSFGFCNVLDENQNIASFDGTKVSTDVSYEWDLTLNEFIVPLYRDIFGISTGFGLCWRNYHLKDDMFLEERDGVIGAFPADEGIDLKKSRLRMLHVTLPVLLEWQPHFGYDHDVFFTAGVVGGVKAFSNYKVEFKNADGNEGKRTTAKGLNIPPLTLDYMIQAGYKDFSIFAKYSPLSLFREGEGPQMHTVSIGFTLQMND